ncbi:hypothetical protein I2H31_06955 [Hymenobacter sp. BT662]|uniref:DUF7033 domain-containing protein n=1 Tax=Hymenobacter ruricola TaxID=2791023 RepID=A0ABS0I247_9BACT|nr:hypothetical protein [Hymenobacter ruricola]
MPAPRVVAITSELRLAYVLRHFWQTYPAAPRVTIGYGPAVGAVAVADGAGDFFAQARPYPAAPNWREWQGQRIPFFFDSSPEKDLLTLGPETVLLNADIIAGAFYLLSGWQEYFSAERDRHGRFPYAASVQQQYNFVTLPVVNYYFDVLKTAVEHVTGQRLQPRTWGANAPFAAFITHDIDNLHSAWKAPAKAALQQRQWRRFGQLVWQHLTRPDAWNNLEAVAAGTAEYGAKSTFFLLPETRPGADGTPNADYNAQSVLPRLAALQEALGAEISLHGSIGTATDAARLAREAEALQYATAGLRFHYLRWEPRLTPAVVDAAQSFIYDSTLGFAEHFGFRNSYCLPFYPFNFATGSEHDFLEIPLNVMDATLHHPNYLQLRPEEMLPALAPMLAEVARFGGVATVLWHNENFDPANETNGPHQFAELMEYLQQQGAAFLTGREIWQQFPA